MLHPGGRFFGARAGQRLQLGQQGARLRCSGDSRSRRRSWARFLSARIRRKVEGVPGLEFLDRRGLEREGPKGAPEDARNAVAAAKQQRQPWRKVEFRARADAGSRTGPGAVISTEAR